MVRKGALRMTSVLRRLASTPNSRTWESLTKTGVRSEVSVSRPHRRLQEMVNNCCIPEPEYNLIWTKVKNNWIVAQWSLFTLKYILHFIWKSRSQSGAVLNPRCLKSGVQSKVNTVVYQDILGHSCFSLLTSFMEQQFSFSSRM